jgi:lipopolysaccharide transport system ATP-binding protein
LAASAGTVDVRGRLRAVLDLGAGFHEEASGRENVIIGGMCLGDSRAQLEASVDEIIDFAGVREAADRPFRTYSSGMRGRLMFAVAFWQPVEVLIVDEALATGDEVFVRRCTTHIESLCRGGATAVLVSHSLGLLERLCERWLYLENGRLIADGDARWVRALYEEDLERRRSGFVGSTVRPVELAPVVGSLEEGKPAEVETALEPTEETETPAPAEREPYTDDAFRVVDLELEGIDGRPTRKIQTGDPVRIRFDVESQIQLSEVELQLRFADARGFLVARCSSLDSDLTPTLNVGHNEFEMLCGSLELGAGHYHLGLSLFDSKQPKAALFEQDELLAFTVHRQGLLQDVPYEPPSHWGSLDWIARLDGGSASLPMEVRR